MNSIVNSLGFGSGIDTAKLVADLTAADRERRDAALQLRSERTGARISALGQIRAGLDAFTSALGALARGGDLGVQPVSGDPTVATIARDPGALTAAPFSAALEVTRLASAQTVTSARFAAANAPVGYGTLTIAMGTVTAAGGVATGFTADPARPAVAITVGAGNDSLAGLRDAINAANAGVTATIVDDGVGARLALKSVTGAANGFTVTAATAPGSPAGAGLAAFAFAPGDSQLTLAAEATNARVVLDGVAVERSTNTLTDLVAGYRIDLRRAALGAPVAIAAERDGSTLRTAVGAFVDAYNEINSLLTDLAKPGNSRETAGPLYGQAAVRSLRGELARLTSRSLATGSDAASLAEIGIRTARDGSLGLDTARLDAAVAADPKLLERLFVPAQGVTSPAITIRNPQGGAKPGQYDVTDLIPATSGRLTGGAVPAAFDFPLDIDVTNAGFTAVIDGFGPVSLTLPIGSYASGASFAVAFQSAINANPMITASGRAVSVGWDAGRFHFVSRIAGSRSMVQLTGLDATLAGRIGLDTPVATAGTDVAGSIAGRIAIGNGTRLTASASSGAAGLVLDVGGAAPATARVTVSEGLSGAIERIRDTLSRGEGGLATAARRFAQEQAELAREAAEVDRRSAEFEASLSRQFTAMDRAVASYQRIGDFLTQQVDLWSRDRN